MTRFDRLMTGVIAALSVLLLALAAWAMWSARATALPPGFLYLVAASTDETQVWHLAWDTRAAQLVAQLPGSVIEAAVLHGAERVAYPVARADGGHDLWLLDVARRRVQLWLDCAPDDCLAVAPAPASCGVVYTRVSDGQTALWRLACDTSTPQPLFPTPDAEGHYASWSPDGARLAYLDSGRQLCVVDVTGAAETLCLPSQATALPVWSPDGAHVLVTDARIETGFASRLVRVDVVAGKFADLSGVYGVEDDAPAWSPDGQWIAFRRQAAGAAAGKQLWRMRADGSEAHVLAADAAAHHGPPVWADNGALVLFSLHSLDRAPALQAISVASATVETLASNGYRPHRIVGAP
jgi:Tol biopolymer transport system component